MVISACNLLPSQAAVFVAQLFFSSQQLTSKCQAGSTALKWLPNCFLCSCLASWWGSFKLDWVLYWNGINWDLLCIVALNFNTEPSYGEPGCALSAGPASTAPLWECPEPGRARAAPGGISPTGCPPLRAQGASRAGGSTLGARALFMRLCSYWCLWTWWLEGEGPQQGMPPGLGSAPLQGEGVPGSGSAGLAACPGDRAGTAGVCATGQERKQRQPKVEGGNTSEWRLIKRKS